MLEDYLLVHKSILPDYFISVLNARSLIESGKAANVSQAVKMVGISRSTYYKYKDYILETGKMPEGRKAVLSMLLTHETGILSHVLTEISKMGGSVLTITQSLPIHNRASVTISLDMSSVTDGNPSAFIQHIAQIPGVENPRIVAID